MVCNLLVSFVEKCKHSKKKINSDGSLRGVLELVESVVVIHANK